MYVVASEAASLLKIPHRRLLELLRKGRVKGAYKSGRFWLIPLYNRPLAKVDFELKIQA